MALAKGSYAVAKPDTKTEVQERYVVLLRGEIGAAAVDGKFESTINLKFKPDEMIVRQAYLNWQNLGACYSLSSPQLTDDQALCIVSDNILPPINLDVHHVIKSEIRGTYQFYIQTFAGQALASLGNPIRYFFLLEFIRHPR